jgi:hypothetical protein
VSGINWNAVRQKLESVSDSPRNTHKWSDPTLGGDSKADCPLCEIERVRGMCSSDPIAPRSFLTWFTYVSVTRRWEGAVENIRDDDKRAVPYTFWPPRDVMETVVKCGKKEPTVFGFQTGRGFILARNADGRWSVSISAAQPLFQTSDANQIATLCHRLEGWLAEPAIRPATPEELGQAVQVLRATLKAPRRGSEDFIRSLSPDNS